MMKQWLILRSVRIPLALETTAPISSSVWRLPFISASALPARTNSTALAADAWLCSASTSSTPPRSKPTPSAARRMRLAGPTSIESIRRSRIASATPRMEDSSQGCATATLIAACFWAAAMSCSYLS
jgi:hypothetical protein